MAAFPLQVLLLSQGLPLLPLPSGTWVTSRSDCVSRCHFTDSCNSAFFNRASSTCHMSDAMYSEDDPRLISDIRGLEYMVLKSACSDGYTMTLDRNLCYKLNTTSVTRGSAQTQCQQEGGELIRVDTGARNDVINQVADIVGASISCQVTSVSSRNYLSMSRRNESQQEFTIPISWRFWIGGRLNVTSQTWQWDDQSDMAVSFWDQGQPDEGLHRCIISFSISESRNPVSRWHDTVCDDPYMFMCESPVSSEVPPCS